MGGVSDAESRVPPAAQGGRIHSWPELFLCNTFLKGAGDVTVLSLARTGVNINRVSDFFSGHP